MSVQNSKASGFRHRRKSCFVSGDSVDKGAPRPGAWDELQPGLAVSREPWCPHTAGPGRSFSLPPVPPRGSFVPSDHKPQGLTTNQLPTISTGVTLEAWREGIQWGTERQACCQGLGGKDEGKRRWEMAESFQGGWLLSPGRWRVAAAGQCHRHAEDKDRSIDLVPLAQRDGILVGDARGDLARLGRVRLAPAARADCLPFPGPPIPPGPTQTHPLPLHVPAMWVLPGLLSHCFFFFK